MNEFEGLWKISLDMHLLEDHHRIARKNEIISAMFSPKAKGKSPSYLVVIAKGGHPVRFVFQSRMASRAKNEVVHADCAWATRGTNITGEQQKRILEGVRNVFTPLAQQYPNHALAIEKAIGIFGKIE